MEILFNISNEFNEHHEIIPVGQSHDPIEVLIDAEFKSDLVLCIIESVSVGNITGIGTTHIRYIGKNESDIDPLIQSYLAIIEKIKEKKDGISTFFDWYQRENSYKVDGEIKESSVPKTINLRWAVKHVNEDSKYAFENYIKRNDVELSDEYIREYLTTYIDLLKDQSWFNTFKYFTIIVKPISVFDKITSKYIPLGNLYLHFGTIQKKDEEFYRKLVNKLLMVWFKENGANLLREVDKKSNTGGDKESYNHIPPFLDSKKHRNKLGKIYKNGSEISLKDLYIRGFDTGVVAGQLEFLIEHNNSIFKEIPTLLKKRNQQNQSEINKEIITEIRKASENIRNASLNNCTEINQETLQSFFKVLSKRRIALACLFIFNLTKKQTHQAVTSGEYDKVDDFTQLQNREKYLWNVLFIVTGNHNLIYKFLSIREKEFLKNLNTNIKSIIPGFTSTLDNFLHKSI